MSDAATIAALTQVIESLTAELESQRSQNEASRREIRRLVTMVEGLTRQLDELLRDRDEERRAELARVREAAQAVVAASTASASPSTDVTETNTATKSPPDKTKGSRRHEHGRAPIPEHVPRDTTRKTVESCSACGSSRLSDKHVLVSEEWDYIRAHVRVRRTERVTRQCGDCMSRTVPEQAPMPFDRAACTFAMMAWLCFAKASLFLPLDRVQRDFTDQGVHLASSTLTRWQQRGADLLSPIAAAVRASLLADSHIRTDGTGLLVVFPRVKGNPKKGSARPGPTDEAGYLAYRPPMNGQILVFGNDEHAVFWFTETKEGRHALDFLTVGTTEAGEPIRWKGTVTADALSAHDILFVDGDRIESGCNAHGFRKFRDEADKAPLLASRAMAFISRFYTEEAKAREQGLAGAERLAWRTERIGPIVVEFRQWLEDHIDDLLATNPVRKAMKYYLNHWEALTRFLSDPAVELDNNWSERALRVVNLIRNNSLYAGGIDGAWRLCTLLTLVHTCRLLGVDPYAYLVWALSKVVPHPTNRGFTANDLTPAAYKAAQEGHAG